MTLSRHPPKFFVYAAVITALAVTAQPTLFAADAGLSLKTVEQSLNDARKQELNLARRAIAAETDLKKLRRRSIAIAARAQEHELTILKLEDRLLVLQADHKKALVNLKSRRKQLIGLMAALQRIAMHPPVALIALPMKPVDTIRSALLLRRTVPAVDEAGRALRDDLKSLAELSDAVSAARDKINVEFVALTRQHDDLHLLVTRKAVLAKKARKAQSDAQNRAAKLGREARDLKDLVARLTEQSQRRKQAKGHPTRPKPLNDMQIEPSATELIVEPVLASGGMPVLGRIVRRFNEPSKTGKKNRGISIQARPGSTVVAPRDGRVVFAGPFRGLGKLLIIEYQAKYHLLLAGLARIDTEVGENVLAGEPVGIVTGSKSVESALYVELRRNGQPINPLPWLAAGKPKVNG